MPRVEIIYIPFIAILKYVIQLKGVFPNFSHTKSQLYQYQCIFKFYNVLFIFVGVYDVVDRDWGWTG